MIVWGQGSVDYDISGWRKVADSGAGGYFEIESGVLAAVPLSAYRQTEDAARRSLRLLDALAREHLDRHGRKLALIIIVDRVATQDAGARRVWSREADARLYGAFALVCRSLLARAIGSFYMGLHRPSVPTRMFGELAGALEWARLRSSEDVTRS